MVGEFPASETEIQFTVLTIGGSKSWGDLSRHDALAQRPDRRNHILVPVFCQVRRVFRLRMRIFKFYFIFL